MQTNEINFQIAFKNSLNAMLIADDQGNYIQANNAAAEMFGYSVEELLQMNVAQLQTSIPPDAGAQYREYIEKGKESGEFEFIRSYGKQCVALYHAVRIRENFNFSILADITNRKEIENELRTREDNLLRLYNSMTEGLSEHTIIYDDKGKAVDYYITHINRAYEKILGLRASEVIGRLASDIYNTSDVPFIETYARVAETGEPESFETYFPPMKKHFVISVFSPAKDQFVTLFEDITEKIQQQEHLNEVIDSMKKKEAEQAILLRVSQEVLESHTFEDAARKIFSACCEITGAVSGYVALLNEETGENDVLFLEAGDLPCTVDPNLPMPVRGLRAESYLSLKTVFNNNFMQSPHAAFMPAGHVTLHNVLFAPLIIHNKAVGVLGIANKKSDFTREDAHNAEALANIAAIALQRSRAEESLKLHERVVLTSKEPISVINRNYQYILVNGGYEQFYGISRSSIIGKKADELIGKEVFESRVKPRVDRCFAGEIVHFLEWFDSPAKGSRYMDINYYPLKTQNGAVTGLVSIARDITEIEEANKVLKQAHDEKQSLLSELQHRVKNSFNILYSMVVMRKLSTTEYGAHQVLDELAAKIMSITELYTLLYNTGTIRSVKSDDYLIKVVQSLDIVPKNVSIHTQVDRIELLADTAITLGLIVTELITNAVKYAFPKNSAGSIHLSLQNSGNYTTVIVSDNGKGLPEDFSLGKDSSIGLQLVQAMVKQLGGTLEYKYEDGCSWHFSVNLSVS